MSFLSYIKDPTPFLIIGGQSGVGKTSILDYLLLNYPDYFEQPESYTSRKKRNESDRYIFVTKEEMEVLYQDGNLVNLDEVYDEYYGIRKGSITEIKMRGRIPIKEIHPNNFWKFKSNGLNTINILIENKHLSETSSTYEKRPGRENEDLSFENSKDYDIKLNISGMSSAESANYLMKKVLSFRTHLKNYPHPAKVDEINKSGYNRISKEFNDRLRVTTKNFHDLSLAFWKKHLTNIKEEKSTLKILELGSGNGWLFNTFPQEEHEIYCLDISNNMSCDYCYSRLVSTARHIPITTSFFDLVVGSLIDPLLCPEVFIEVERVLKPNGEFIFTTPSKEWANNLSSRTDLNKTTFILNSGEPVQVYSFCDSTSNLMAISSYSSLNIDYTKELYLPKGYKSEISNAITDSATNAGKSEFTLPILLGTKCTKNEIL